MKTIATVIASLLLSLGMLTTPAHAEEAAAPPPCDQTVQEWQARAIAAEANATGMVTLLLIEKDQVADANKTITRLVKIQNRKQAKIAELYKALRAARRN